VTPTAAAFTDDDLAEISRSFEGASAAEIVTWAAETFGDELAVAASMEDAVLIDVASTVHPGIDVVFVDTGYHLPETLATAQRVQRRYPIELRVVSDASPKDDLWRQSTDACCARNKVAPFDAALRGYTAWMSGLRRADSPERADAPIVTRDGRGLISIRPLANWSDADVDGYIADHDIIVNPLRAQGYLSIGCQPCTHLPTDPSDPRSGRWVGQNKTECGLHD
jgi:phosphoadenosine phosphosulfate reductase